MGEVQLITVVIATLGCDSLASTIRSLNSGTVVPAEILVCVPVENASKVAHLDCGTTSIVQTDFRGQVAQRGVGFRRASHSLVMQLDDDLLLDRCCLERLAETLRYFGPKAAVAPALLDKKTGQSVYKKPAKHRIVLRLYYWLMNGTSGYVPGKIDLSGSSVGVDPSANSARLYDVEWLAGGCVLHPLFSCKFEEEKNKKKQSISALEPYLESTYSQCLLKKMKRNLKKNTESRL